MVLKRQCSGELCKSKRLNSVPVHRYTGIDDQVHNRCLTCIPNDERQNFHGSRYEQVILNDVLHQLEKKNSSLDVIHNKGLPGSGKRPDLLIRDGKKLIALEIDEKQHNKEEDAERRKILQDMAKKENKQLFDVRFQVNEHKNNPVVEKYYGGLVHKNDGYSDAIDHAVNKIQKIKDNKSNTKIVEILANEIKNMNIQEQSSSKECVCGAKQINGKKCSNKCRSNGKCGKHGG